MGLAVGNNYGHNSLIVSDGGELVAPYRFYLGFSGNANTNNAVFETGARFTLGGLYVGEKGSCGNTIEFKSGASGTIALGVRIGGWTGAGCGNTMLISNATVSVTGVFGVGAPSDTIDVSGMFGNNLTLKGTAPSLTISSSLIFKNRSFLLIEIPHGGHADGTVPISANAVTVDATSSLKVNIESLRGMSGNHTLISTANGITVPAAVLSAANAQLSAQSDGMAKLMLADGGKSLVLKVAKGMVVSFR